MSAHHRPPSNSVQDHATNRLDITPEAERPSTDAMTIGPLIVTFDVRYVTGEQGERVAARQAEAIASLARWAARNAQREGVEEEQEAA